MPDPHNMSPDDLRIIQQALDRPTTVPDKNQDISALLGYARYQTIDNGKLQSMVSYLLTVIANLEQKIEHLEAELTDYHGQ